ncbi:MAG TPA: MFS transporter, partial [Gemmataceae bacterium]|nr:MFS transporter [Gemmataceae bacterium]
FVPESEKWQREKEAGNASHWATRDLIGVLIGATAAAGVITLWVGDRPMWLRIAGSVIGLVVVTLGFLYPARQFLWRAGLSQTERRRTLRLMLLAAGLSGVPLLATWSGVMWMYMFVPTLPNAAEYPNAKAWMQVSSSLGAAAGCVVGALLCVKFGRRAVYAGLCVLSLITIVGFYNLPTEYGTSFILSAGLLGFVTASFYGWLPLYLPELFPTKIRATGQGFGFNFGRIIAAVGGLQMANLLAAFDNKYGHAVAVVAGVYFVGLVLIAIAPETKGKPLPD